MADLVNDLADWIAARLSPALSRDSDPYALFAHAAEETETPVNYTDPYSVMRAYGGDDQPDDPTRVASIQVYTVGTAGEPAMTRAEALYAGLLETRESEDGGKVPASNFTAGDWFIEAIRNLRPPALIGRDARRRVEVVFNFDVAYRAA